MAGSGDYVRARDAETGQFLADDPATPGVNEAWVPTGGEA